MLIAPRPRRGRTGIRCRSPAHAAAHAAAAHWPTQCSPCGGTALISPVSSATTAPPFAAQTAAATARATNVYSEVPLLPARRTVPTRELSIAARPTAGPTASPFAAAKAIKSAKARRAVRRASALPPSQGGLLRSLLLGLELTELAWRLARCDDRATIGPVLMRCLCTHARRCRTVPVS